MSMGNEPKRQTIKAAIYGNKKMTEIDLQVIELSREDRRTNRRKLTEIFMYLWECMVEVEFSDEHHG